MSVMQGEYPVCQLSMGIDARHRRPLDNLPLLGLSASLSQKNKITSIDIYKKDKLYRFNFLILCFFLI